MIISKKAVLPFGLTTAVWGCCFIYESVRLTNISYYVGMFFPSHQGRSWISYYLEEFTKPLASTWWVPICGLAFSFMLYFLESNKASSFKRSEVKTTADQFSDLAKLKDQGVLTEQEFQKAKDRLLSA